MRYIIFSLVFLLGMINISIAQDLIIKKNGDELNAKVLQVGPFIVSYKMYNNPEGPVYDINKADVFMIKYQNGTKDVFSSETIIQSSSSNGNFPIASRQIKIVGNVFYFLEIRQNDISLINLMKMNGAEKSVAAYKTGWRVQRAGSPLISIGVPSLILGILIASVSSNNTHTVYSNGVAHTTRTNDHPLVLAGSITSLVGLGSMITGVVLKVNGRKKKALAVMNYNNKFD